MRVVQHAVLRDFVDAERGGCLALRARPLPSVVNEHGFLIHPRLPEGFFAPGWFRCAAGFFGFERRIAERGGFEPPVVLPTLAFQASTLNRSDTSPSARFSGSWILENLSMLG